MSTKQKAVTQKRREESEKMQPATGFRSVIINDDTYNGFLMYSREGENFSEIATRVLKVANGEIKRSNAILKDSIVMRQLNIR